MDEKDFRDASGKESYLLARKWAIEWASDKRKDAEYRGKGVAPMEVGQMVGNNSDGVPIFDPSSGELLAMGRPAKGGGKGIISSGPNRWNNRQPRTNGKTGLRKPSKTVRGGAQMGERTQQPKG